MPNAIPQTIYTGHFNEFYSLKNMLMINLLFHIYLYCKQLLNKSFYYGFSNPYGYSH